MKPGRLLVDPPLNGATNMARDAALLAARICPSLRFYRWAKPTLSLGYFQTTDGLDFQGIKARGGEIVRRSTGGKAILHEHELTYSICCPEDGQLKGGPAQEMQTIHIAIKDYLSGLCQGEVELRGDTRLTSDREQSSWCFEDSSPLDLVLKQRKLLGSAARRQQGWVLFHGSLVISPPQETPNIAATNCEPELECLANCFSQALNYNFQAGEWEAAELLLSEKFSATRYANPDFTFRR